MPITYACDHCGTTAPTLDRWLIVSVQFISNNPTAPNPPGGRMLDATAPDLVFDKVECRDAWCTQVGLAVPGSVPSNA